MSLSRPKLLRLEGIVIPDDATIETLKTAGKYDTQSDKARSHLTDEHFKVTVHGPRDLSIGYFDKRVTSEYVEAVATEMGCGVGLVEDLLGVGAHPEHREPQQQFPIIALGSSADVSGHRHVPFLRRQSPYLGLYLPLDATEWLNYWWFLFVGKD